MSLYTALVSIGADSGLPRDQFVNTLHFNEVGIDPIGDTGAQTIADEVAAAYASTFTSPLRQWDVRIYNNDDEKPRPVRARKQLNVGSFPASTGPRETALCLSFYADRNLPRQRGRIYIPAVILSGGQNVRPTSGQMTSLINLYNQLINVGGIDTEWSVFSRVDNQHRQIQHGWVDDEWDTVRSRGLKSTTRSLVTAEG